jgi:sodium/bile acid cotransporter 7
VVAYCTIGYRSAQYVEKLRKEKNLDAYNLRGSVLAWTHAGGELETTEERRATTDVHVFGKDWDLAPSEFDAVYFQAPALSYVAGFVPDALKPWRWFKK